MSENDEELLCNIPLSEGALKSQIDVNNCMLKVSADEQEPICMTWVSNVVTKRMHRRSNRIASRQQQSQSYEQEQEYSELNKSKESTQQIDQEIVKEQMDNSFQKMNMSSNGLTNNTNDNELNKEQQPQRTNEGCFPSEIEDNNHGNLDINNNTKLSQEFSQLQEQQQLAFINTQEIFTKSKGYEPSQLQATSITNQGTLQDKINKVKSLLQSDSITNEDLLNYFKNYEVHNKDMFDLGSILRNPSTRLKKYKQGAYLGVFVNSQRYGQGIMLYGDGCIYEGDWQNDMKFGYGYELFPNGSSYNGGYINNKSEGVGVYMWSNGEIYDGQWIGGQKHGSGMWSTPRGDTYIGEWKRNRPDGYGVHTWINGDRYEGEFKLSLKHGEGQEHFANGDYFTGQYVNGKPEGIGEYKWNDGSSYQGQFRNGLRHGKGVWKRQNKKQNKDKSWDSYEGEYENDKKCGLGKFIWSSGDQYDGEFFNDLRHGQGVMQFADGSIYEGEWELGKQSGHGIIKVQGKVQAKGIFKNNKIIHKNDEEEEEEEVLCEDSFNYKDDNFNSKRKNKMIMKVEDINNNNIKIQMKKQSPQSKEFQRASPIPTKTVLRMRNENIKADETQSKNWISSHQINSNNLIFKEEKNGECLQRTRKQKHAARGLADQQWQLQQSKVRNLNQKNLEQQQKEIQQTCLQNKQGTTATSKLLLVNLVKDLPSPIAAHSQISQDSQLPKVFASRSYTLHKNLEPLNKGEDQNNNNQNHCLLTPINRKKTINQDRRIQNENEVPPDYLADKSNSSFSQVSRKTNMIQKQHSRDRNQDSLTIEGQGNCSTNISNANKTSETSWNSCGIISFDCASTSISGQLLKIPSTSPYAQRLTPIHRTSNKKSSSTPFNKKIPQGEQQLLLISENDNLIKFSERINKSVNILTRVKEGEEHDNHQEQDQGDSQNISKDTQIIRNYHLNQQQLENKNKTFTKNFRISSSVPKCRRANSSKENTNKHGKTNIDTGVEQVIAWRPAGLSFINPHQRSVSTDKQRAGCHTAQRRESKMRQLSQELNQQMDPPASIVMFRQTNRSYIQKSNQIFKEKCYFP